MAKLKALWERSLVMADMETESLWSHLLGECMRGPLIGKTLEILPSVMTTWEDWVAEHPKTTLLNLPHTTRRYNAEFYAEPERFVLGIIVDGTPKAYAFSSLAEHRVIEDKIGDEPVLVIFHPKSTRAAIFSRRLDKKILSFTWRPKDEILVDESTGSEWNPVIAQARRGPLKTTRLTALPSIVSYKKTWKIFHPESGYWGEAIGR